MLVLVLVLVLAAVVVVDSGPAEGGGAGGAVITGCDPMVTRGPVPEGAVAWAEVGVDRLHAATTTLRAAKAQPAR